MLSLNETAAPRAAITAAARGGTLLGKRYVCANSGLEVLCTKTGEGSLAFDDVPLVEQGAKPLPPSD